MTDTHYALEYHVVDDFEFDSDSIDVVDSLHGSDSSETNEVVIRKSFPEFWIFDSYSDIGYELKNI